MDCHAVTELYGRTFATWTLTTCALCLICAKNPRVPAIYGESCLQLPWSRACTRTSFFRIVEDTDHLCGLPAHIQSDSNLHKSDNVNATYCMSVADRAFAACRSNPFLIRGGHAALPHRGRHVQNNELEGCCQPYDHCRQATSLATRDVMYGACPTEQVTTSYSGQLFMSLVLLAGLSILWMGAGWNYYTNQSVVEPE